MSHLKDAAKVYTIFDTSKFFIKKNQNYGNFFSKTRKCIQIMAF